MVEEKTKINLEEESNVDDNVDAEDNIESNDSLEEKVVSVYLDRFESLEDGTEEAVLLVDDGSEEYSAQIVIPANFLPDNVSDGDYLKIKITYDEYKTKAALEAARQLLDS